MNTISHDINDETIEANVLPQFLETLGLDEEPMGIFYTDEKPAAETLPSGHCSTCQKDRKGP